MPHQQLLKLNILKGVKNNKPLFFFTESILSGDNNNLDLTLGGNIEKYFLNLENPFLKNIINYNDIDMLYSSVIFLKVKTIILENNLDELEQFIYMFSKVGFILGIEEESTFDFYFFSAIIGSLTDIFQMVKTYNITMSQLWNISLKFLHKYNLFSELPEYHDDLKISLVIENYRYHLTFYNLSIAQSLKLNSYPKRFIIFNV
jgi:hypothetical protein